MCCLACRISRRHVPGPVLSVVGLLGVGHSLGAVACPPGNCLGAAESSGLRLLPPPSSLPCAAQLLMAIVGRSHRLPCRRMACCGLRGRSELYLGGSAACSSCAGPALCSCRVCCLCPCGLDVRLLDSSLGLASHGVWGRPLFLVRFMWPVDVVFWLGSADRCGGAHGEHVAR